MDGNSVYENIINKTSRFEHFEVPDFGIYTTLWVSILGFEICFILGLLGSFLSGKTTILPFLLLSFFVVLIVCTVIIPLLFLYKNNLIRYRSELNSELDNNLQMEMENLIKHVSEECKQCIDIRKEELINSYNLYTYPQLLQIEARLGHMKGDQREIYAYSVYREDGPGVGIPEADVVVGSNSNEGVSYYILFYKELKDSVKLSAPVIKIENSLYINLTEVMGEDIDQYLDYQFYKQTFFDIMLYKYNENDIDGFYCLNFPIAQNCSYKMVCKLDCNNRSTENVFYKKMPRFIAKDLYQKLNDIVKNYGGEK